MWFAVLLLFFIGLLPALLHAYTLEAHSPSLFDSDWAKPNTPLYFSLLLQNASEVARFSHLSTLVVLPSNASEISSVWGHFLLLRRNSSYFTSNRLLQVPAREGKFTIKWGDNVTSILALVTFELEVSCSDGNVCNGVERLTSTKLKKPQCSKSVRALCDDLNGCTQDACLANGICSYTKKPGGGANSCKKCKTSKCKPQCSQKECGFDQCFGECGTCKGEKELCASSKCKMDDKRVGTCFNPIDLTPMFALQEFRGTVLQHDLPMHLALDVLTPRCYVTTAPELMFRIDMPIGLGYIALEVRTISNITNQTTLQQHQPVTNVIIEANPNDKVNTPVELCQRATYKQSIQWSCEPDFSDLHIWSNAATWMMKPGHVYFIAVEREYVPGVNVTAQFRMVPECTPNCAAKQCGDSGCPGITCGTCATQQQCLRDGTCSLCTPQCSNSTCGGSDGCGGQCQCIADRLDQPFSLKQPKLPNRALAVVNKHCNNLQSTCTHVSRGVILAGCRSPREFCSTTCECIPITKRLPDLSIQDFTVTLDDDYVVTSTTNCAFQEGCLRGTGPRRLLRFDTNIFNQGSVEFRLPHPPQKYPDLFEFAPCHGHWHIKDFLLYQVVDYKGKVVAEGEKRSFCLMDMYQLMNRPDAPCGSKFTCSRQGLSVGWTDVYDRSLDCQFIDVTNVEPGSYTVRQCVNPARRYLEASYENNCVEARVTIGVTKSPVTHTPTRYPTLSNCAVNCPSSWLGDKYCDNVCNIEECMFDMGDCDEPQTCGTLACSTLFVGDGICDRNCMQQACDFDGGDCE